MVKELHPELVGSGLATMFKMQAVTTNEKLAPFLGQNVRYKRDLVADPKFVHSKGTQVISEIFFVTHVQKNWKGDDILRGYATSRNDTFGKPIDPDEIEIVR